MCIVLCDDKCQRMVLSQHQALLSYNIILLYTDRRLSQSERRERKRDKEKSDFEGD